MHSRTLATVGAAVAIMAGVVGAAVSQAGQSAGAQSSAITARPLMLESDEGEPYRFEVIGLPAGRGAMLARLSGVWKILKIERGKSHAWTGSFISADDALTSLAGDV